MRITKYLEKKQALSLYQLLCLTEEMNAISDSKKFAKYREKMVVSVYKKQLNLLFNILIHKILNIFESSTHNFQKLLNFK